MKSILTVFLLTIFSISAFADKKEVLRTLECTGTAQLHGILKIKARITDTKYTDEIGSEYWSTLTITDAVNPSKKLYGNLTSTDTSVDIGEQRDTPRDQKGAGVVTYDLYPNKTTSAKAERTGLLVIGASCTKEEEPNSKKCKSPKGISNYIVEYMYGGSDVTDGDIYTAKLSCKLK